MMTFGFIVITLIGLMGACLGVSVETKMGKAEIRNNIIGTVIFTTLVIAFFIKLPGLLK